jgi:3-oxoacyl-[acyl-carrier-protein] synthase II
LPPSAVGYVSAHGTATDRGDVAESLATAQVLGHGVPISSLKGHFGHTLGACGAIEAWLSVEMMRAGWFAPSANLQRIEPDCADLDYLMGDGRELQVEHIMSNNFAFGGINTSLIFRRAS